jgi:hypothetical protein
VRVEGVASFQKIRRAAKSEPGACHQRIEARRGFLGRRLDGIPAPDLTVHVCRSLVVSGTFEGRGKERQQGRAVGGIARRLRSQDEGVLRRGLSPYGEIRFAQQAQEIRTQRRVRVRAQRLFADQHGVADSARLEEQGRTQTQRVVRHQRMRAGHGREQRVGGRQVPPGLCFETSTHGGARVRQLPGADPGTLGPGW